MAGGGRHRIRNLLPATAVLFVVGGCAGTLRPVTLSRLVAANAEARGGASAVERVHAIELQLEITEPGFTVTGHYVATRDGFMRIDIVAGGTRVYTEALGPDGAWQMGKGETQGTAESPAGAAALERGLVGNLYGLHELAGQGYALRLVGSETRDGKDYWVIETTAPDGFSQTLYLDSDTYLVARQVDTSALHPDVDATEKRFETVNVEYRPTAGVQFVRRSEKRDLDTGEQMQTAVVESVAVNPAIDAAIFRRPSRRQR